ncbi:MAG: capsid protein [Cressdnaviricota sp.]|nr:MAG: capsid protein [Cressdnaviricota sp.]
MPVRRTRKGKTRGYRRGKKAQVGLIKKVINSQHEKHVHTVSVNGTFSSTGTVQDLSAIAVGDAVNNREGDRITLKSIIFRFGLIAADTTNFVRVMLVQWLQNDAATAPTIAGIYNSTFTAQPYATFAPFNKSAAGYQWVPLYDKTFALSLNGNACSKHIAKITPRHFKKKAKAMIQYNAGATTGVGKIYVILISDSGVAADPTITGVMQIRFLSS